MKRGDSTVMSVGGIGPGLAGNDDNNATRRDGRRQHSIQEYGEETVQSSSSLLDLLHSIEQCVTSRLLTFVILENALFRHSLTYFQ